MYFILAVSAKIFSIGVLALIAKRGRVWRKLDLFTLGLLKILKLMRIYGPCWPRLMPLSVNRWKRCWTKSKIYQNSMKKWHAKFHLQKVTLRQRTKIYKIWMLSCIKRKDRLRHCADKMWKCTRAYRGWVSRWALIKRHKFGLESSLIDFQKSRNS